MCDEDEARIAQLEQALAIAQVAVARLERSTRRGRRNTAMFAACLVAFCGWAAYAEPSIKAVAVVDPLAKLSRRMDEIEKRLQGNIDLLELRVRKLEQKPDSPDNDEGKTGGRSSKGEKPGNGETKNAGGAGEAGSESAGAGTATKVKAPFEVDDDAGHPIARISDANGARMAEFFDGSGQVLLKLGTAKGRAQISVISSGDPDTRAVMALTSSGEPVFAALTHNVAVATLGAPGGHGQVDVNNSSGQPIATLAQGNNGGKLEVSDLTGRLMVEAGVLPTHVGIVRTGPASRAPGGLMGVPGSYITGKGN